MSDLSGFDFFKIQLRIGYVNPIANVFIEHGGNCHSACLRFVRFQALLYYLRVSNPNRLTTREVARVCRVSDATVKRWAAAGLIESERTNGGHRRFRAEDVAKFQCEQGLGLGNQVGDNSVLTTPNRSRLRKELGGTDLFRSMICGCDEEVANTLIKKLLNGETLESVFDDVITPELQRVGRLWMQGKLSVAEEHLASRTVLYALYKVRSVLTVPEKQNKLAICCGVEGDFHGLPTDFALMVYENCGWNVLNFGPNTPLFSLHKEIKNNKPDMLCVSGCILEDIERLTLDFKRLNSLLSGTLTKLVLGGRAFSDIEIRNRFPADHYPNTFSELADYIRSA